MKPTDDWPQRVRAAKEMCRIDPNAPLPDDQKIFNELVVTERVRTWKGFQKWADGLQDSWAFRGHTKAAWDLEASLDRTAILRAETKYSRLFERQTAYYEKRLLREFQLRAHHHLTHLPGDEEIIEWFALMQHYGAATRLLDWSWSPYVALYFAVENGDSDSRQGAVWAIDCDWVTKKSAKFVGIPCPDMSDSDLSARMSEYANEVLNQQLQGNWTRVDARTSSVAPANPKRMNERMAAQQALFLCQLNPQIRFYDALLGMILRDETPQVPCVRKLNVSQEQRITFLHELKRMNITAASLFPGLEGYTRSLMADLEIDLFQRSKLAAREMMSTLEIINATHSDCDQT